MKPAPKFQRSLRSGMGVTLCLSLACAAWSQTYYQMTLLSPPPGQTASVGRHITEANLIMINNAVQSGFAGSPTLMPNLGGGTIAVTPRRMNNLGHAAGQGRNGASVFKAFFYDGTSTTQLPDFGATFRADAWDINDSGLIVGEARTGSATSTRRAVKWVGGVMTDLTTGMLTNQASAANATNNLGQIVGEGRLAGDTATQPIFWSGTGPVVLPKLPGDDRGRAYEVNENGIAVGQSSRLTLDTVQAAKWDLNTLTVTPMSQPVGFSGYWVATTLNNAGVAAGITTQLDFTTRAAVYENNIGYDLNHLVVNPNPSFILISAEHINNNGVIIGYGQLSGVNTAFVLEPVGTATAVAPTNYFIDQGTPFGGDLTSILSSDDNKVFILSDENEPNAIIRIEGSGAPTPTLAVKQLIETGSTRDDLSEFHETWSNNSNSWVVVGSRISSLDDGALGAVLPAPISQWISNTGDIRARVRWIPFQDIETMDGWLESVDSVRWEIV